METTITTNPDGELILKRVETTEQRVTIESLDSELAALDGQIRTLTLQRDGLVALKVQAQEALDAHVPPVEPEEPEEEDPETPEEPETPIP